MSLPDLISNSEEFTTASEDSQGDSKDEVYSNWKEDTTNPWVPIWTRINRPGKEDNLNTSEEEDRGRPASGRGGYKEREVSPGRALLEQLVN